MERRGARGSRSFRGGNLTQRGGSNFRGANRLNTRGGNRIAGNIGNRPQRGQSTQNTSVLKVLGGGGGLQTRGRGFNRGTVSNRGQTTRGLPRGRGVTNTVRGTTFRGAQRGAAARGTSFGATSFGAPPAKRGKWSTGNDTFNSGATNFNTQSTNNYGQNDNQGNFSKYITKFSGFGSTNNYGQNDNQGNFSKYNTGFSGNKRGGFVSNNRGGFTANKFNQNTGYSGNQNTSYSGTTSNYGETQDNNSYTQQWDQGGDGGENDQSYGYDASGDGQWQQQGDESQQYFEQGDDIEGYAGGGGDETGEQKAGRWVWVDANEESSEVPAVPMKAVRGGPAGRARGMFVPFSPGFRPPLGARPGMRPPMPMRFPPVPFGMPFGPRPFPFPFGMWPRFPPGMRPPMPPWMIRGRGRGRGAARGRGAKKDTTASVETKKVEGKQPTKRKKEWITEEMLQMIKQKDRLYKKHTKNPTPENKEALKSLTQEVSRIVKEAKRNYQFVDY